MTRWIAAALILALPIVATAAPHWGDVQIFTYWGECTIVPRPAGYYDPSHGRSVEVECGANGQSVHLLMTPREAGGFGEALGEAAVVVP
jgi:hypothetical protein